MSSETFASINKQMVCNSSSNLSFTNYTWSIPPQTCPSGNTTGTIPGTVLAIDIPTFDPATAQVSVPCSQAVAVLCPPTLKGNQLPTANWSASSTAPGYYAHERAILNRGNAAVMATQPSLSAIENAKGGIAAFKGATFSIPMGRLVLVLPPFFRPGSSRAITIRRHLLTEAKRRLPRLT
jgi:hypothetical protein